MTIIQAQEFNGVDNLNLFLENNVIEVISLHTTLNNGIIVYTLLYELL